MGMPSPGMHLASTWLRERERRSLPSSRVHRASESVCARLSASGVVVNPPASRSFGFATVRIRPPFRGVLRSQCRGRGFESLHLHRMRLRPPRPT